MVFRRCLSIPKERLRKEDCMLFLPSDPSIGEELRQTQASLRAKLPGTEARQA
jgi:hypothetical protein